MLKEKPSVSVMAELYGRRHRPVVSASLDFSYGLLEPPLHREGRRHTSTCFSRTHYTPLVWLFLLRGVAAKTAAKRQPGFAKPHHEEMDCNIRW